MADIKAIKKLIDEANIPILEVLADIKARLEAIDLGKASKATSSGVHTGCQYKKKTGEYCTRKVQANGMYCPDHPEGMTRLQYKKMLGEGGESATASKGKTPAKTETNLKMDPYEENDDFELLTAPILVKNVLVSSSKPHTAYFRIVGDKFEPIEDDAMVNALKKLGVIMADQKEIQEVAENLGGTVEPPAKKAGKATLAKITPKKKQEDSEEEDEDEDEGPKVKVIAKLAEKKKPAVVAKVTVTKKKAEESEEEEEEPAPKPTKKETPAPKKPAKKLAEEEDAEEAEEETKSTPADVAGKAVSKVPSEGEEKSKKRDIPNLKGKSAKKPVSDEEDEEDE